MKTRVSPKRSDLCRIFLLSLALIILSLPSESAEAPLVIPIWPGATIADSGVGAYGKIGAERVRDPSDSPTKDAKWITNVKTPTITVFPAPKEKNSGVAIIICPGGGYWNLGWDLEGEEVAAWLNKAGVNAFVLKYRVPRRAGEPERLPAPGPLLDAQRAVSLVRSRASEWGINHARIGIIGFSAGGHLAIATATHFDKRAYEALDDVDKVSCRPDFAAAIYPGYLIEQPRAGVEVNKDALAPYMRIPKDTPPIFFAHAADDSVAGSENSVVMHLALKKASIPSELHIYAKGGHGFGVRPTELPCSRWPESLIGWLQSQSLLATNKTAK